MGFSFLSLLNASISASWLALVVMGLRFLLKRAPKSIRCALWALVAIRLLCPVSIESPLSLIPSSQTVSDYYLNQEADWDPSPAVLEIVDNPLYPEPVEIRLDTEAHRIGVMDLKWTAFFWPTGMAAMAGYALLSWLRIRRKVAASIPIGRNIRICDYIGSPFILGLVRPVIYLPSGMDQGDLDHVLAHEMAHLARRDHWWKALGYAMLSIHWFNPILWVAYILLCRDIELACDEKVIRDLDAARKKAYSSALLQCSVDRPRIAACPLAFGEAGVKERVKNVLHYKRPALWVIILALILCCIVAVCFLTDPISSDPLPPGVYRSQEKVYWAWHSSQYVEEIDMEVADRTVRILNEGTFPLETSWQETCPISQERRESLAELADLEPAFALGDLSSCRFLIADENHFLVDNGSGLYLVRWLDSDIHLEMIGYIFRMVPEQ